jgi:4-amino-4-deoxy-L-arabinose transferase-like glycosyltransferase
MTDTTKALSHGSTFAVEQVRWPTTYRLAAVLALVLAMVAARCWVVVHSDFETDEPYYWLWSHGLAWGYFDHPPMIAYFIRLGTLFFGDTILGIRSMDILAMAGASALAYILTLALFDDRRLAALALLWFSVMPHTSFFSIITFPDTPAILFWSIACVGLAMVWRSGRGEWWYLVGVATGLLLLSKYTGVFLIFGIAAWLVLAVEMRPWLMRREPYIAGMITLVLFCPVIVWNAQHGWVSFVKQFGRALDHSPVGGVDNMAAFVGIQAAFVSPLIFVFIIAGLAVAAIRGLRRQEANWLLLALTSAPMLFYFVLHAFSAEVLPQWPSAVYAAGVVAAVAAFAAPKDNTEPRSLVRCCFNAAPWVGLVFTLGLLTQMTIQPAPIAAAYDPLSRFAGWADLSAKTRVAAEAQQADYIVTNEQGLDGALAFYLRDVMVFQASESIRYESLPPVDQALLRRAVGIYISLAPVGDLALLKSHYDSVELVSTIWRTRGDDPIEPYYIYRLKGYRGGLPL